MSLPKKRLRQNGPGRHVCHRLPFALPPVRRKPAANRVVEVEVERRVTEVVFERQEPEERRVDLTEAVQYQKEVDLLQRRLAKLSGALENQEETIRRLVAQGQAADSGVASIYDSVQGLDTEDPAREAKKSMMDAIFLANLELKERVASLSSNRE